MLKICYELLIVSLTLNLVWNRRIWRIDLCSTSVLCGGPGGATNMSGIQLWADWMSQVSRLYELCVWYVFSSLAPESFLFSLYQFACQSVSHEGSYRKNRSLWICLLADLGARPAKFPGWDICMFLNPHWLVKFRCGLWCLRWTSVCLRSTSAITPPS